VSKEKEVSDEYWTGFYNSERCLTAVSQMNITFNSVNQSSSIYIPSRTFEVIFS
jgi:hypothetical protein